MTDKPLVLVADDDEDILSLLAFRLEREGYDVLATRDGDHALALARSRRPAVALLDVSMPGLDGLEVTRAIRAELEGTKVVLVTARAGQEDVQRGLGAGADGYVTKPFSPAHLAWQLAALLDSPA